MSRISEEFYIAKRKLKAFVEGIPFYICHIFPIKSKKVVMWTFEGDGGYCDSPKYIAEELLRRNVKSKTDQYEIIWLVNELGKAFPNSIQVVKNTLWRKAFHLSTAEYWIANTRTSYGTIKRKKTIYIQTWHAVCGIKPIGLLRGNRLSRIACLVSEHDSRMIDYVLSGNEWSNKMWPEGLIYNGSILQTGVPRCDVLFNGRQEYSKKFREIYDLPLDAHILVYAPTFRGGSQSKKRNVDVGEITLDFEEIVSTLEKKFGGEWYIFLRLHPQLAAIMKAMPVEKQLSRLIDVSQYPDMDEIIAGSDALLTDYSSIAFESALVKQPTFLFIEDEEDYVQDRGELLFDLKKLPFPMATNMGEMVDIIEQFEQTTYEEEVDLLIKELGFFEKGSSSKNIVDFIEKERIT